MQAIRFHMRECLRSDVCNHDQYLLSYVSTYVHYALPASPRDAGLEGLRKTMAPDNA